MWSIEPDAVNPREAIAWFRARVPMTPDEYRALEDRARRKAFTVAGVMDLDLLNDTFKALDKAVAEGTTFETFVEEVGPRLEATWGKADSSRLQTIFSTNVQSAYSAGRWRQLTDPDVLAERPVWTYDAVLDGRTSELCKHLDGTTLPADDPFWETHTPPLHFNCRSGIISLTESQAAERGVTKTPPKAPAASSFGLAPDKSEWQPQYAKYPYELTREYAAEVVQSATFDELLEGKLSASLPVAALEDALAERIKAKTRAVLLSKDTLEKNTLRHPELPGELYRSVQGVLDDAQLVIQDGDQTLVFLWQGEQIVHLALKATRDGSELYLTTLHYTFERDVARVKRRGRILRDKS